MSQQVYRNDVPATPNRYVSDLVRPGSGGATVVDSLVIAVQPTLDNTNPQFLVRDSATGLVKVRDSSTVPHSGHTERHRSVDQLTGDGVDTIVLFDIADTSDVGLSYDAGTGVFTVVEGGVYSLSYSIAWEPNAAGTRWGFINFASAARYASSNGPTTAGVDSSRTGAMSVTLTATETFTIHAFQDSGIPLQVLGIGTNGIDFTSMSAQRISPAGVQ